MSSASSQAARPLGRTAAALAVEWTSPTPRVANVRYKPAQIRQLSEQETSALFFSLVSSRRIASIHSRPLSQHSHKLQLIPIFWKFTISCDGIRTPGSIQLLKIEFEVDHLNTTTRAYHRVDRLHTTTYERSWPHYFYEDTAVHPIRKKKNAAPTDMCRRAVPYGTTLCSEIEVPFVYKY